MIQIHLYYPGLFMIFIQIYMIHLHSYHLDWFILSMIVRVTIISIAINTIKFWFATCMCEFIFNSISISLFSVLFMYTLIVFLSILKLLINFLLQLQIFVPTVDPCVIFLRLLPCHFLLIFVYLLEILPEAQSSYWYSSYSCTSPHCNKNYPSKAKNHKFLHDMLVCVFCVPHCLQLFHHTSHKDSKNRSALPLLSLPLMLSE